MNKKIIFTIVLALMGLVSLAQEKPGWIYNKPKPANDSYLYVVEAATGRTETEARNQAVGEVFRSTAMRIGQPFESSEINKALQNGTDYNVISRQYNIPINKVCEYSEYEGNGYKVYILCQVAKTATIPVQWSDYSGCSDYRQYFDGVAVVKSALLPGLGQFHKGQTGKGIGFLAGEAVGVAGIVVSQSQRHTYINKMNSTNNASLKKAYADKANTWTTVRNISIGAAAAIYVWNVLDAVISKGNHKYSLSYGGPVNLYPVVTDESVALSLSINF